MFQVTAVLSFSICAEPMLQVYVIHLSSVLGRKVTFYRKKLYFMGSTFIYWSLISLSAPWAAVCDPSSSSLPDVFVFHLLVQPALPSSGQHLQPTQVWRWCRSTPAVLRRLALIFSLHPCWCRKGSVGCGGQQAGLGATAKRASRSLGCPKIKESDYPPLLSAH